MSNYTKVPTISQRLRELDRRVLREENLATAEGWTKSMGRWRWTLGSAIFTGLALGAVVSTSNNPWLAFVMLPAVIFPAFQAGNMKAEHDRLKGNPRLLGTPRPPGL